MTSAIDRPLDELRGYRPKLDVPSDLAEFWSGTLAQARSYALDATFTPVESALRLVDVFDVRFAGYAGQPIAGWLVLPRQRSGPLPCIVQYVGYGGGRGLPHQALTWAAFGYAHFVMDTRGQGSQWSTGVTPDVPPAGATPHVPGFLTLGLPDRDNYYYRRVYTDAVRAIEAAASHPAVDTDRIVSSCGGSQGGGLALAAARARRRGRGSPRRRTVPLPFSAVRRTGRRRPLPGARSVVPHPPAARRPGFRGAGVFRRRGARPAGPSTGALLGRDARPDLPAVLGFRGVQPLCRRRRHQRLGVERTRRRRRGPDPRPDSVARHPPPRRATVVAARHAEAAQNCRTCAVF